LGIRFIKQDDLPCDSLAHEFVGEKFGGVRACVIFVDAAPDQGPKPHAFINSGQGRLRQIDTHLSPRFITEWLDGGSD
jgi:hypothetical protein